MRRRLSWKSRLLAILFVIAGVAALIALPWIGNWVVTLSGWDWWNATLAVVCGLFIFLALAGVGFEVLWEDEPAERASLAVSIVAVLLVAVGVTFAWLGFHYLHPEWTLKDLTTDFYANLTIDLISVGVTVLIIDRLYDRRSKLEEKQRIIEQLRSPSAEFSKEALWIVTEKGWLRDGSLRRANLFRANLEGAVLRDAILWRAFLWRANLEGAILSGAVLRGAILRGANLSGANLYRADLKGATYTATTTWPEGFDPVAAGAILKEW